MEGTFYLLWSHELEVGISLGHQVNWLVIIHNHSYLFIRDIQEIKPRLRKGKPQE